MTSAYDKWLTTKRDWQVVDDHDPPCPKCGAPISDHEPVHLVDEDDNDYETYACPQPATGSTMAVDNDPAFTPITLTASQRAQAGF